MKLSKMYRTQAKNFESLIAYWRTHKRIERLHFESFFDFESTAFYLCLSTAIASLQVGEHEAVVYSSYYLNNISVRTLHNKRFVITENGHVTTIPFYGSEKTPKLVLPWLEYIGFVMLMIVRDYRRSATKHASASQLMSQYSQAVDIHQDFVQFLQDSIRNVSERRSVEKVSIRQAMVEAGYYKKRNIFPRYMNEKISNVDLRGVLKLIKADNYEVLKRGIYRAERYISEKQSSAYCPDNVYAVERVILTLPFRVHRQLEEQAVLPEKRGNGARSLKTIQNRSSDNYKSNNNNYNGQAHSSGEPSITEPKKLVSVQHSDKEFNLSTGTYANGALWVANSVEWLNRLSVPHVSAFIQASGDTGFILCSYAIWGCSDPQGCRKIIADWMVRNQTKAARYCKELPNYRSGDVKHVIKHTRKRDWFRRDIHGKVFSQITGCECLYFSDKPDTAPVVTRPSRGQKAYTGIVAFYNCQGRQALVFPMDRSSEPPVCTEWTRRRFSVDSNMGTIARADQPLNRPPDNSFRKVSDMCGNNVKLPQYSTTLGGDSTKVMNR